MRGAVPDPANFKGKTRMSEPSAHDPGSLRSDSAQAVRFLAIKAATFILVPLIAAGLAVAFLMPK